MIVETNSLTTIAVGAAKAQTEAGDTSLKLPNLIMPVIELIEPTQIAGLSTQLMQTSFQRNLFTSRTNQATASISFCLLGRGLWELRFNWTERFSFAAPLTFNTNSNHVQITSPIGGISAILATFLPVQNGSFQQSWNSRVLLRENAEIFLAVEVTTAADFLDSNLTLNASKLL